MNSINVNSNGTDKPDIPASLREQHGGCHYKKLVIQPAQYNQLNQLTFCESEAIKYLTRHKDKNGAEDIKKAIHFCQMVLDMNYGIQSNITFDSDPADPEKKDNKK